MSGQMHHAVAVAAMALADQAQAKAEGRSVREIVMARMRRQVVDRSKAAEGVSLPGKTWVGISVETRAVLVMLGASQSGDVHRLASQPWESFSDEDKAGMAATARQLQRDLRNAASLF